MSTSVKIKSKDVNLWKRNIIKKNLGAEFINERDKNIPAKNPSSKIS